MTMNGKATTESPFDFGRVNIHTAKAHNLRLTDAPKSKEVSNSKPGTHISRKKNEKNAD